MENKKKLKKTLSVLLIALPVSLTTGFFSGCDGTTTTEPATSEVNISINFNEEQVVVVEGTSTNIVFSEVEDNRVPLSECEMSYGSRANIKIILNGIAVPIQIFGCNTDNQGNILDNTEYIDTLGYHINAYRLEPYPSGMPVNQSDYLLKIKISKL